MIDKWHNCYDDSWQGIIVPEAFSHPAKMSYGLTKKIFKHALSESWIKPGDVVVDPFGGIGSTGIIGASLGLRVVCVELEEKFVALGKQNFELNRKAFEYSHFDHAYQPVIIQGDSRQLYGLLRVASILSEKVIAGADCVVGSPPFAEAQTGGGIAKKGYHNEAQRKGVFDLVGKRSYMPENQGITKGNLAAMKPGSVDSIISSPPYEGSLQSGCPESKWELIQKCIRDGKGHASKKLAPSVGVDYGNSKGQIGATTGETFWAAARQIVSECHKILKPGGHAIWVVKAFVRKGKLVDFPGDWRRLCESEGFQTVHEHHAMLVKETEHAGLFGTMTETKERKSFFRRLAERKAALNAYWESLNEQEHAKWIEYATDKAWLWYDSLTVEQKAELIIENQEEYGLKYPAPTEASILSAAKAHVFDMDDKDTNEWNEHVRIDFEVILCMVKK